MISAILAAKALKKLRGGEMFSVGASPFNSRARQLYGGWTVQQAGNNLWGQKQAYQMMAKYSENEQDRKIARKWLKMYRVAAQDPNFRARVREAGKPYWDKAIYPKMTPEQKRSIYALWNNTDFTQDVPTQLKSRVLRGAPFPGPTITNFNRAVGVPFLPPGTALPDRAEWGQWRTTDDLKEDFIANRTINRSYTAAEVAAAMGIPAADAQRYMDQLTANASRRRAARRAKMEDDAEEEG